MNLFPRTDLAAWHQFDAGVSGNQVIFDASGNNRHLTTAAANSPVLITDVLAGQPVWYFNGSRTPLVFSGNLTLKHVFIVAAIEGANFSTNNGLLTAPTGAVVLVGNSANSNSFIDLGAAMSVTDYSYRKADILFPRTNQIAPNLGKLQIIELQFPDGLPMNGIQIGQDRGDAARRLSGFVAENIMFSSVLEGCDRLDVYEYLAMRYQLWRQHPDGADYFPFAFDRTTVFTKTDRAEISEAEGLRGRDRVVRYLDDAGLGSYDFRFENRAIPETDAADAFLSAKRLHLPFWIEDKERGRVRKIVRDGAARPFESAGVYRQNYAFTGRDY